VRPVERGDDPGGYAEPVLAYRPLVQRIGRYCSYCESPIKNGQVEHVLPRNGYGTLTMTWSNLLLACLNCNATKQDWPTVANGARNAAFWPDTDNTARAYEYRPHLPPRAASLTEAERQLATALLTETGVDRHPDHPRWSEKDDRWDLRDEAWNKALGCWSDLQSEDSPIHRKRIAEQAASTGFWSVWRTVFQADPEMLSRFNLAFTGTASSCFDPRGALVPRPGGRL
jgi:hypothetical protein